MDPSIIIVSRQKVFAMSELLDKIFSYLDPRSVKAVALVSR